jgi:flagellar M-ring protein FliF
MAASGNRYYEQFSEMWRRMDRSQRNSVVLFSLLAVLGIGAILYYMNRVDYELLYSDLSPEDASAITARLKEEKREYTVEGSSIKVKAPKDEIDKLKLEIAGSGSVRSGRVGFEIFDKTQFGLTDFTEQVNLQRALEGELARTIGILVEISSARVHLVLPKDSIFEERKEEAKASVALRLKRGAELSKQSVAGIRGLVAGAVPGLKNYNVSILDDEGRLLAPAAGSSEAGRAEIENGMREQLEKEAVNKVVSILEPIVGKGKVHANASVELDSNSVEQTEETVQPNGTAILSQQKSEERVGGAGAPTGIPGTQSNVAGANTAVQKDSSQLPDRSRQSETTNYELNKTLRHTVQPKGAVRRLSIAVILDYKTSWTPGPNGKTIPKSEPRSQQDLDGYRELVLAAVGFDKDRGDVVTLENVPFYSDSRPEEIKPPVPWYLKYQQYSLPAMKYLAFLLLFLLVYLILFRPIRNRVIQSVAAATPPAAELAAAEAGKALGAPGVESAALPAAGETEGGAGAAQRQLAEGAGGDESEGDADLAAIDQRLEKDFLKEAQMLDLGTRKYSVLKKKLIERALKDPEAVSNLVRSWVAEKD